MDAHLEDGNATTYGAIPVTPKPRRSTTSRLVACAVLAATLGGVALAGMRTPALATTAAFEKGEDQPACLADVAETCVDACKAILNDQGAVALCADLESGGACDGACTADEVACANEVVGCDGNGVPDTSNDDDGCAVSETCEASCRTMYLPVSTLTSWLHPQR